jgi:hypothetical protein
MAVVGQFGYGSEVLFITSVFCLELGRQLAPIHQSPRRRGLLGNSDDVQAKVVGVLRGSDSSSSQAAHYNAQVRRVDQGGEG